MSLKDVIDKLFGGGLDDDDPVSVVANDHNPHNPHNLPYDNGGELPVGATWLSPPVVDETHTYTHEDPIDWMSIYDKAIAEFVAQTAVMAKIRITFNRPLTWAERDAFAGAVDGNYTLRVNPEDPSQITVSREFAADYTEWDYTRSMFEAVAEFVATEFVNVYPRAVKTISPEVRV